MVYLAFGLHLWTKNDNSKIYNKWLWEKTLFSFTLWTCKLSCFVLKFECKRLQDSPFPCQNTATLHDLRGRQPAWPHSLQQKCKLVQEAKMQVWQQSLMAKVDSKRDNTILGHPVRSWLDRSPVWQLSNSKCPERKNTKQIGAKEGEDNNRLKAEFGQ